MKGDNADIERMATYTVVSLGQEMHNENLPQREIMPISTEERLMQLSRLVTLAPNSRTSCLTTSQRRSYLVGWHLPLFVITNVHCL